MPSHRLPSPPPDDAQPSVAELAAVLARVEEARLVGRSHAARTSVQDAYDRVVQLLGGLGDAARYLGEYAVYKDSGRCRAGYRPLTLAEINDSIRAHVKGVDAISELLDGFVTPATLRSLTERGGGGFGALEAQAAIADLAQRLAAEPEAAARKDLEAQGCRAFQRLAMRTQRGPDAMPLGDHYDLPRLARIHDALAAIWMQAKDDGRPIPKGPWTSELEDGLGGGASAFASRAIAETITDVEGRHGTGHTWAAGTVAAALRASRAPR